MYRRCVQSLLQRFKIVDKNFTSIDWRVSSRSFPLSSGCRISGTSTSNGALGPSQFHTQPKSIPIGSVLVLFQWWQRHFSVMTTAVIPNSLWTKRNCRWTKPSIACGEWKDNARIVVHRSQSNLFALYFRRAASRPAIEWDAHGRLKQLEIWSKIMSV